MGDMKTPDFDDLLAAFDIPDATSLDAKEAIQESQDDAEGHLKHPELCMDNTASVPHPGTPSDAPAVSVIVKNTNRQDSFEPHLEKESSQLDHLLQNGFRNSSSSLDTDLTTHSDYTMLDASPLNGDCSSGFLEKNPLTYNTEKIPTLSKSNLSSASSPESEEILSNGIINRPHHGDSFFSNDSLLMSADTSMSDNHGNSQAYKDSGCEFVESPISVPVFPMGGESSEYKKNQLEKTCDPVTVDDCTDDAGKSSYPTPETNPSSPHTCVKTQPSKLSSCLDALVALNAQSDPSEQTNPRDLQVAYKENTKVSPKVPISPRSPRSPLEVVKRLIKQPDSPMSICSDSSGKASPALVAGSPLAIPRVRIKTIKTSSGQIKRTVTSIFPDSEPEDLQSPFGSSPSQSSVDDSFFRTMPVCHSQDIASEVIFENGKHESSKTPPSGCASANTDTSKSSKKPQSPNDSCGLKRTQKASKQRKLSPSPTSCSANPNYLPKALHLANLNLVPHSVAASVTARSSTHRQDHTQLSSPTVCSSVPLVHQVQKTSPNTRAIIPNTAAGTLNRLLNYTNPVPTYVPNLSPPPDSDIKLPAHGFCCLECGDSFGLEKSLAFHYSRRSVHIEVTCTHCSKTLVFFNRCALLAHARDHKNKGMMMQCSQLFMKPIAVDQMSMSSKPEQSATQTAQGKSTVHAPKNNAVMPLYPDKVVQPLKCLECDRQMLDYTALAGHFQRASTESGGLTCKVCAMLLPNKCSYRAHQRIHTKKSPFCCPECGALGHSLDFQKHVKENCLHYARKIGYSCLHCETLFMSIPLLKSHIEEKHCEVLYKCTICPVAFKSSDGCHMHVKSKHGGSEPSYQLIHKCSCETVFKKKQLLYQHLHQRTCIFRCPECTSFFMKKIALVQHFKGVHGGVFRGEKYPKAETESASHKLNSVSANHRAKLTKPGNKAVREARDCSSSQKSSSLKKTGWTCGECLLWMPDRETYVSHMKTSHGKSVKRNPCRLCERSFSSSTGLRRHIRIDHDGKKKVYTCWYCTNEKMTFTQLSMLKNHLSLMHGIKNPDISLMAKLASQETSKSMGLGPKRSAAKDSGEKGDSLTSDTTPSKRLKPLFRCAKCGLTTGDPVQFQKHIPQHKTDADTPQCQNCGLCFTSQVALSRHLYIVHKVKEPQGNQKNSPSGFTPKYETGLSELQTEMCSKTSLALQSNSALYSGSKVHTVHEGKE
ncbi:zinc finger protein 592 [Astyanax mexicanus]|uniref:Zinc finger protein 592 n=1 Tax=Astyanax mexicanus TaxID=7994 RepID=A0A8B9JZ78_ASTMX|nr:zinc finger protein 592 [Astyanax mexicanus]